MSDKRKSVQPGQMAKRFKSFFRVKSKSPPPQTAAAAAATKASAPNRSPKAATSKQTAPQKTSTSVEQSSPSQAAAAATTASAPNRSPKQPSAQPKPGTSKQAQPQSAKRKSKGQSPTTKAAQKSIRLPAQLCDELLNALKHGTKAIDELKLSAAVKEQLEKRVTKKQNLYIWLYKEDWEELQSMNDVEKQLEFIIRKVLYIGVDSDYDRITGHCNHATQPFDLWLQQELSKGRFFAVPYFHDKSIFGIVLESICIHQLKDLPEASVHNVHISFKLSDACKPADYVPILMSLMYEAISNPKRVSFTNKGHIKNAKNALMLQRDRFVNEYNGFIVKVVETLKSKKVIPAADKIFDCTDVDTAYYLCSLEKAGIVSIKNNTIELNN